MSKSRASVRRGFTVMEVVVATAVLGVVAAGLTRATVALERNRRAVERVDYASRELDNLLERFTHRPWEEITTGANLELPEELTERLPEAKLTTTVTEETEPVSARRVTMQLVWRTHTGTRTRPIVLTTWVFSQQESTP